MNTVQDALRALTTTLKADGIPDAAREARLLLAHAMGVENNRLTLLAHDKIAAAVFEQAQVLCTRRATGEPVSHIRGYRAFFGRRFSVDRRVLDPRPETELLVLEALKNPFSDVLDLGTGSGAILISLLAERPGATGIGVDISEAALEVATQNAETLGVAGRAAFLQGSWFDTVGGLFDLIVANPPYIAAAEMPALQPELRLYEPRVALTDEADGLRAYRAIAAQAPAHLKPGGRLLVEIGATQARQVCELFSAAGLDVTGVHPDLDGRDRVVSAMRP